MVILTSQTDDDGDENSDTVEMQRVQTLRMRTRPAATIITYCAANDHHGTQSVNDKTAISNITISGATGLATVDTTATKWRNYNPAPRQLGGTPNVTDWGSTEEKRV